MMRGVQVPLRFGRPAESAVAPPHLHVPGQLVHLVRGAVPHDGLPADARGCPPRCAVMNTAPREKWLRQSHGVAMRRRNERVAEEPNTK